MFTGIIKECARLKKVTNLESGLEFEIESREIIRDIGLGDSVCVNGCCLTVKRFTDSSFFCDLSYQTVRTTNFSSLSVGSYLNLEDALKVGDKLGGHFVSGHVDGVLTIQRISKIGDFHKLEIVSDPSVSMFIVPKGSIAIDGISLTVAEVEGDVFSVALIGHTYSHTNLRYKGERDTVNAEIDILARYVCRMLQGRESQDEKDQRLKEMLYRHGFAKK